MRRELRCETYAVNARREALLGRTFLIFLNTIPSFFLLLLTPFTAVARLGRSTFIVHAACDSLSLHDILRYCGARIVSFDKHQQLQRCLGLPHTSISIIPQKGRLSNPVCRHLLIPSEYPETRRRSSVAFSNRQLIPSSSTPVNLRPS